MRTRNRDGESGQTLALAAVVMVAMVAVLALVVDTGLFLMARRELQNAADAGALAGAYALPVSTGQAHAVAAQYASVDAARIAGRLCLEPASVTVADGTLALNGGSVFTLTVTAQCRVGYTFGRILGLVDMPVSATATAAAGSLQEATCAVPFGIEDANGGGAANGSGYAFGETVELKISTSGTGNAHAMSFGANGGNQFRKVLSNQCDTDDERTVTNETVSADTQPGAMIGPTRQGLLNRGLVLSGGKIVCPDAFASVVDPVTYQVVNPRSPCLGAMPVVRTWTDVHGRVQMDISGFAMFFMDEWQGNPDEILTGRFVKGTVLGPIGAYNPLGALVTRMIQ